MTYEEARFFGSHYPQDEEEESSWDDPSTEHTTRMEDRYES